MLNKNVIARHPLPTIEELISDVNGAAVFSKLDLKDGYHQVALAEESRQVVYGTFIEHFF
jgi:hypothetical protein